MSPPERGRELIEEYIVTRPQPPANAGAPRGQSPSLAAPGRTEPAGRVRPDVLGRARCGAAYEGTFRAGVLSVSLDDVSPSWFSNGDERGAAGGV
jgi:hypothetical protein